MKVVKMDWSIEWRKVDAVWTRRGVHDEDYITRNPGLLIGPDIRWLSIKPRANLLPPCGLCGRTTVYNSVVLHVVLDILLGYNMPLQWPLIFAMDVPPYTSRPSERL